MMTGHESRTYGTEITWKDGNGSVMLIPGEEPRKPHPFPSDYTCPHCGRRNGNVRTETFFRCWTCGHTAYQWGVPTLPMTEEMKQPDTFAKYDKTLVTMTCTRCGKDFSKMPTTERTICIRCQNILFQRARSKAKRAGTSQSGQSGHKAITKNVQPQKSKEREDTVQRVEPGPREACQVTRGPGSLMGDNA